MKREDAIDFQIRWAWHRIAKLYNTAALQYGGSVSIGQALLNIDLDKGTPSTSLGPQMGMEPTSLSRTLKTMEDNGLIKRRTDRKDKRVVRIYLTDKGKEKRELAKETVIKFNTAVRKRIPDNKINYFMEIMNEINETLKDEDLFNHE